MMQPGFSTAALIPLPHSHSDWRFPASLEDPAAAWALPRDVVQSFSCALQQEFSFPSRVFIPSFLEQTQLSGGQQDFLLQVPINQGYNYFLKAPFFFFLSVFPQDFPATAACGTSSGLHHPPRAPGAESEL